MVNPVDNVGRGERSDSEQDEDSEYESLPESQQNSHEISESKLAQSRNPLDALVTFFHGLLPPTVHTEEPAYSTTERLTAVTLYYDESLQCCVAVLSKPARGICSVYFQCRIEQGTGRNRSNLYYELDGFLRPQLAHIQRALHPHPVQVAVGALELSDKAQQTLFEQHYRQKLKRWHKNASGSNTSENLSLLAKVLEIGRLHRLQEDLDFVNCYSLAKTSSLCRQVARDILRFKRQQLLLSVTPYVDGSKELGYSSLTRADESNLVQHTESGQAVIYRKCDPIELVFDPVSVDKFVPVPTHAPQSFSWSCREVALAQIHSWWIAECEYMGQKLVVEWHNPPYDCHSIVLDRLRLEAGPRKGIRDLKTAKTAVTLNVVESKTRALDTVTLSYSGEARIAAVQIPWMTLVKVGAKLEWERLTAELAETQQLRPLLSHEVAYVQFVQELLDCGSCNNHKRN